MLVHETAHQWWYSLVGNDQTRWPFLDEALAGFSEYVYYWDIARTEADMRAVEDYIRNDQLQYNAFLSAGSRDVPIGWANDEYDPTTAEWGIAQWTRLNTLPIVVGNSVQSWLTHPAPFGNPSLSVPQLVIVGTTLGTLWLACNVTLLRRSPPNGHKTQS